MTVGPSIKLPSSFPTPGFLASVFPWFLITSAKRFPRGLVGSQPDDAWGRVLPHRER
jgi:hypothetical protein